MAELIASGISKTYGNKAAVQDVSLSVRTGEVVGLLGPNGAGKTTSFYCIVGLTRMDAGSIAIDGFDLSNAPMHVRARRGLSYLPQESSVFRQLSVRQNVMAIAELRKNLNRVHRRQLVDELLREFRLDSLEDRLGAQLSGGERRRLEIARALASEPRFMLLDEPFAGVDPISVHDIKANVQQLAEREIGVLITDHNVRETLAVCNRIFIVAEGLIIAQGTAEDIVRNDHVRRVYLGDDFRM